MKPIARSLCVCALVASCARAESATVPDASHAAAPQALEVVAVASHPLDTQAHLVGELTAFESVAIQPRVAGFVQTIPVDRASRVHRGDLLARLVAPELAAQRAEAQARVRADESTLQRLRAAAQTPGVVAGHDVELAAAAVDADRERVRALSDLERYLTITAPFDGMITERNVHPGALVGPPSNADAVPMMRIAQLDHLRLTVAVPEQLAGVITEGSEATFTVRAWPQVHFSGPIRRPSHVVDVRTRTEAVEIDVDNHDGRLAPGMFAEVTWPVRRSTPSLFVPASAIVQTTDRTFVVRVRNGTVEQVPVQRGAAAGNAVEVLGALGAGDLVARRGSDELRNGTVVSPRVVALESP